MMPMLKYEECIRRIRELKSKLQELEEQAYAERAKRDELNLKVKEISSKIREKREIISNLIEKLKKLKEERNQLLNELKNKKREKDAIKDKLAELRAVRREIISKMREIRTLLNNRIPEKEILVQELERLEWEYQTTPLPVEIEEEYIRKIETLRAKIQMLEEYDDLRNKYGLNSSILEKLVEMLEKFRKEMNNLYIRIQELNTEINELSEKIGNVKTEINELVQQREEFRGQAGDHHKRYINLLSEIRNIKDELTRLEFLAKASKLAVVVEKRREKMRKRAEEIYEKYKRGGTLTLDEFKLLMEFGFIR